jgi:hypothetical protein
MCQSEGPLWPREWWGWTVYTHGGDEVGTVVGRFDGGPHNILLRVHRQLPGGRAVFAVPASAIAHSGFGTIRLTAGATSELPGWLVYMVRAHRERR